MCYQPKTERSAAQSGIDRTRNNDVCVTQACVLHSQNDGTQRQRRRLQWKRESAEDETAAGGGAMFARSHVLEGRALFAFRGSDVHYFDESRPLVHACSLST